MMSDDAITEEHSYYWPSKALVPITPQARRAGFEYPMYVTPAIWAKAISWSGESSKRNTGTDKRIFQLLESCSDGLTSRLSADSADEEGFLYFKFEHFYWERGRKDKAKKKAKMKIGCRLFLDPDTKVPWMLLLDPDYDYGLELKKGPTVDAANDDKEIDDVS